MSRVTARLVLAIAVSWLLFISGCAHDEVLNSITITPANATIEGAGLDLHFTAIGNYSHPPNTKDITTQVTWASSAPQIISVDQNGVATSGLGCGTNLEITATSNTRTPESDSVVIGLVAVNVTQPAGTNPNCD